MNGIGTLEFCDGRKFVGSFIKGKVNGLGTFYSNKDNLNTAVYGEWIDNKLK